MTMKKAPWFFLSSIAVHAAVGAALFVKVPAAAPPREPAPTLAGDTFDLAAFEPPPASEVVTETAPPTDPGTAKPTPPRPTLKAPGSATTAGAGTGTSDAPPVYGAVGDRSAVDVAVAFTRSFPQASSADPFWATVPFGELGATDVTFVLGEDGALESWSMAGTPGEALSRAVNRTMALIKGRMFVATGRVTKLHVTAKVSPDEVHDGLHGDVFAVGGSFSGGEGSAFFALSIGRRVDVTIRAR